MKYKKIVQAEFLDRPNRFIAHVKVNGKTETVHVKNTGRCKELLIPGCRVILEDCTDNPNHKTGYDLIAVYKHCPDGRVLLINMDSQAPNKVVGEWLAKQDYSMIRPEFTYGNSRVDFYLEKSVFGKVDSVQKCLMEVKGCTLEKDGMGYFPDAPTERGVKHLRELAAAVKNGYKCYLAFVIQIPGVVEVKPNIDTHPEFGVALEEAKAAGVEVLFLCCNVKEDELTII